MPEHPTTLLTYSQHSIVTLVASKLNAAGTEFLAMLIPPVTPEVAGCGVVMEYELKLAFEFVYAMSDAEVAVPAELLSVKVVDWYGPVASKRRMTLAK